VHHGICPRSDSLHAGFVAYPGTGGNRRIKPSPEMVCKYYACIYFAQQFDELRKIREVNTLLN